MVEELKGEAECRELLPVILVFEDLASIQYFNP
jgi:hypothetical protein